MNNQDLIKELKRERFKTIYDKIDYITPLISASSGEIEVIIDRYLRKTMRFIVTTSRACKYSDDILNDLKETLCYELECNLTYSTNVKLSPQVNDILFNPIHLDEQTLEHLHNIAIQLGDFANIIDILEG